jgi:hypothetical protein
LKISRTRRLLQIPHPELVAKTVVSNACRVDRRAAVEIEGEQAGHNPIVVETHDPDRLNSDPVVVLEWDSGRWNDAYIPGRSQAPWGSPVNRPAGPPKRGPKYAKKHPFSGPCWASPSKKRLKS